MKQSEIRRALEDIGRFIDDVKSTLEQQHNSLTDNLKEYAQHGDNALKALSNVCDYIVDGGEMDLSDELQEIHETASRLTFGEWGYIPNDDKDQERNDLFAHISFRLADLWIEIQRTWEWIETHKAADAQGGEASTPPAVDVEAIKGMYRDTDKGQDMAIKLIAFLRRQLSSGDKALKSRICGVGVKARKAAIEKYVLRKEFESWESFRNSLGKALNMTLTMREDAVWRWLKGEK